MLLEALPLRFLLPLRTAALACGVATLLFGCGPADAEQAEAPGVISETRASTETNAPVRIATTVPVEPSPPLGYYECYYYGYNSELALSSIVAVHLHTATEYESMGERGRYVFEPDGAVLRMTTGALTGHVAQMKTSSGKPAIVFDRAANEVDGKPTIDVSTTWCYKEPGGRTG